MLWAVQAAKLLQHTENKLIGLDPHIRPYNLTQSFPRSEIFFFSYVDDFNPLITTYQTSERMHNQLVQRVNHSLNESAAHHNLEWDNEKEPSSTSRPPRQAESQPPR